MLEKEKRMLELQRKFNIIDAGVKLEYNLESDRVILLDCEKPCDVFRVPDIVEQIGMDGYKSKFRVSRMVFGKNTKVIADKAFQNNNYITEVEFVRSIEEIGKEAFYNSKIKSLYIKADECNIGEGAFRHCHDLSRVELHGIQRIEHKAFMGDTNIEYAYIDARYISSGAFSGCSRLHKVEFCADLQCIDSIAFYECDIEDVTMPDGLVKIYSQAFLSNKRIRPKFGYGSNLRSCDSMAFGEEKIPTEVIVPKKLMGRDLIHFLALDYSMLSIELRFNKIIVNSQNRAEYIVRLLNSSGVDIDTDSIEIRSY